MRTSSKFCAALVLTGALVLSACGGSDSSSDTSATRTKNAALATPGINVKAFTFKRESLTGWETHPTGVGLEDQIQRDEGKHTPCANGRTTIPSLDAASVKSIVDSCGTSQYLIVHYTGFITVPGTPGSTVSVKFHAIKDNTFSFKVGGVPVIDVWKNSPCAVVEGTIDIPAGKAYPINSWFMNFNSGYCSELSWSLDGGEMVVVPPSAFTRTGDESASLVTLPPTTTAAPSTTAPKLTTTTTKQTTTTTPMSETTVKKQVVVTTTTMKATTTTVADQTVSGNAMSATSTTVAAGGNGESASQSTTAPDDAIATEASDSTMVSSDTVASTTDSSDAGTERAADTESDSGGSSSGILVLIAVALVAGGGIWFVLGRKKKSQN